MQAGRPLRGCGPLDAEIADVDGETRQSPTLRRQRPEHRSWPDRQMAQANPGRGENGVADRGGDHRRARLAEPDRDLSAVNELDVELRHVADAQRRIAVEIRVLDLAFDELGSLIQRHAEAPESTAFDLRERAVWVNERARVYDDRELLHRDGATAPVNADPRDASNPCGHRTCLTERGGDAEPRVLGHGSAPSGLFRGTLEHCGLALRATHRVGRRAGIAAGAIQQRNAERDRVRAGHQRRLIHERFDRPIGPAGRDRAQIAGTKRAVGKVVRERADTLRAHAVPVVGAVDGKWIEGGSIRRLRHFVWRHIDGGRPAGRRVMLHRRRLALRIERQPQSLDRRRAKRVEAHVVGTRQHQLHGLAKSLRGKRGGDRIVLVEPAPEPSAERIGAHDDALLWQVERLREDGQNCALRLTAGVDLEAAILLEGESVHRFELTMEDTPCRVGPLELGAGRAKGCVDAQVIDQQRAAAWFGDLLGSVIEDVLLGHPRGIARGPIYLDEVGGTDRGRVGRRAHDDPTGHRVGGIFEHQAREIAFDPLRSGIVDRTNHRAIARRRNLWPGIDHTRDRRVDAVAHRAIYLRRDIQRIGLFTNEPPLRGRLDRQLREFVRHEFARRLAASDDLAIGDGSTYGEHRALARDTLRGAYAEQLGTRFDESDAASGTGAAVNREIEPYRFAAARAHDAPLRIGIDRRDAHVAPVDLEFVSEDAGDGRAYVLAHLRTRDVHGHDAIAVDAVPNGGLEGARPRLLRGALPRL